MKATINGIEVEGTKEEIAELVRMFGTQQQMQPWPQLPSPLQPYTQPYTGTPWIKPYPTTNPPAPWKQEFYCNGGSYTCKDEPYVMWN